jgi:hypothetical protein
VRWHTGCASHSAPPVEHGELGGRGFLALPRDRREARMRRVHDYLIYGALVVIVGCVITLVVWFLAT